MTLPGFTADVSSFSRMKNNYYYWSLMKSDVYLRQNVSPHTVNRWKTIPEPQKEPSETGRRAWNALEKACDNLRCGECRNDCLRFINGLHDAINIKLGKPIRTPNDFIYLRDFINEMSKPTLLGYKYR
jgi:hypothetical protein